MSNAQLMAVVEVDKEDRIICQRDGCGHSVYLWRHGERKACTGAETWQYAK
jgi:ribosomal protein S27AE